MTPAMCLAIAMFFEARNEGFDGMQAVGEVVVNRVEHERFPDTVCGVVFDDCKFSFNCDGKPENMYAFKAPEDVAAREFAILMSKDILNGERSMDTSVTHYHTTAVDPYWNDHKDFDMVGKVGSHIFYSCKGYC